MSSTPNTLRWADPTGTRKYSITFGYHHGDPTAAIQWGDTDMATVLIPRDVLYIAATQGWTDPAEWDTHPG